MKKISLFEAFRPIIGEQTHDPLNPCPEPCAICDRLLEQEAARRDPRRAPLRETSTATPKPAASPRTIRSTREETRMSNPLTAALGAFRKVYRFGDRSLFATTARTAFKEVYAPHAEAPRVPARTPATLAFKAAYQGITEARRDGRSPIDIFRETYYREEGAGAGEDFPATATKDKRLEKGEVRYRYATDPSRSCGQCEFFVPEQNACQWVLGVVREIDVCDLFSARNGSPEDVQRGPVPEDVEEGRDGHRDVIRRRRPWWAKPDAEPRGYRTPEPEWTDWRDKFRPRQYAPKRDEDRWHGPREWPGRDWR
jgi:hypothetical protein